MLLVVLSAWRIRFFPWEFFDASRRAGFLDWVARFQKLDGSSEVLGRVAAGAAETLAIAAVGTTIGAAIGLALLPISTRLLYVTGPLVDEERRSVTTRGVGLALHHGARLIANGLRTVPYLIWAVLMVFMVGLGAFPGALAIGLHTGGVLARLFATAVDHVDTRPLVALRAAGASPLQTFLFGVLPSARPALVNYFLYRFEVNVREAAVLGVVGAGGLGFHLKFALDTFNFGALGTYLLATMALVLGVDAISARLRRAHPHLTGALSVIASIRHLVGRLLVVVAAVLVTAAAVVAQSPYSPDAAAALR